MLCLSFCGRRPAAEVRIMMIFVDEGQPGSMASLAAADDRGHTADDETGGSSESRALCAACGSTSNTTCDLSNQFHNKFLHKMICFCISAASGRGGSGMELCSVPFVCLHPITEEPGACKSGFCGLPGCGNRREFEFKRFCRRFALLPFDGFILHPCTGCVVKVVFSNKKGRPGGAAR